MTNEEMQKAMQFIVNQQAQASAKIDALAEAQKGAQETQRQAQETQKQAQKDAEQRWLRSEERWTRTEEGIRALLSIAEIHEREIHATDERLNALINVVERQISEGRNGKP